MNIQLIDGHFKGKDALEIITQMIHVKIKFQESKIGRSTNLEDVKFREKRIKELQQDLYELRKMVESKDEIVALQSTIQISFPDYDHEFSNY